MARYRQLNNDHRRQIINLKRRNITNARISIQLNCSVRTVQRVWSRYRNTGSSDKLALPGRPRKTTAREDRRLILMSRLSRFDNARQLTVRWNNFSNKNVSVKTVRRRLHAQRVYSRVARLKPLISVRNRQRRVTWANRIRNWTVQDNWSYIVFSDECRFGLTTDDRRVRCWRTAGEAFEPDALNFRVRSNVSIMVWGCISIHGVGELVLVDGNMNHQKYIDVLETGLLPSITNMFGDRNYPFVFQDDNAPCHRPRAVDDWLNEQDIRRMMWPAQSPDANIIENVWNDMSKLVANDRPTSRQTLFDSVFRAWASIRPERIRQLYESLPRRMAAMIRSRGYATKY